MKQSISIVCFLLLFACFPGELKAQSSGNVGNYSELENRFLKQELTATDSAAFRLLGEQRVMQLFDRGGFYVRNVDVASNQSYVRDRVSDQFYPPLREQSDVDELLQAIASMRLTKGDGITLETSPDEIYLGIVRSTNSLPEFTFYLLLEQVEKPFGKRKTEKVWEVFLLLPNWLPSGDEGTRMMKKKR